MLDVLLVVLMGAVRTSHLVLAAGGSMLLLLLLLLLFVLLNRRGVFRVKTFVDVKSVLWIEGERLDGADRRICITGESVLTKLTC